MFMPAMLNAKSVMIVAGGEFIASHDIVVTITLKEDVNLTALIAGYRRMIREHHAVLATKWVPVSGCNSPFWVPFTSIELDTLLEYEEEQMRSGCDATELFQQYFLTNMRLPFRIAPVAPRTLVFFIHHAIANGKSAIAWIDRWFGYYTGKAPVPSGHAETIEFLGVDSFRSPGLVRSMIKALLYFTAFFTKYWLSGSSIMDLSGGKRPVKTCDPYYSIRHYTFNEEDTLAIIGRGKSLGMTFGEFSTAVLLNGFLEFYPEEPLIHVGVATDMHPYFRASQFALGNYTENAHILAKRGYSISNAVKRSFRHIKRGVVYGYLNWMNILIFNKYKWVDRITRKTCRLPIKKRFLLERLTLAYSPMGILQGAFLQENAAKLSIYTNCQSIYISSGSFSGRLCFSVSVPNSLFDQRLVFSITDRIIQRDYFMNFTDDINR